LKEEELQTALNKMIAFLATHLCKLIGGRAIVLELILSALNQSIIITRQTWLWVVANSSYSLLNSSSSSLLCDRFSDDGGRWFIQK